MDKTDYIIVGAGLAGCECALVLAKYGLNVVLFEQKPEFYSMAHVSENLSELVCSNSLRSDEWSSGIGLLKEEMRILGSPFMRAADENRIPAGKALAVDREKFAQAITKKIAAEKRIKLIRTRINSIEELLHMETERGIIIAAGPLASEELSDSLAKFTGDKYCYFYDAIAPVIWADSIDRNIVFRASRYCTPSEAEDGDYLNCPLNREEYEIFLNALLQGETFKSHECEQEIHFEGCMPIEALAQRGVLSLAFGPMKPVGLVDPRTGQRPYAVLQLRAENANMSAYNLVGCQTKLLQKEQKRIFRLIPGLESAEFTRFGSMHRNTYVNAPKVLNHDLSLKSLPNVYLIGQITGVEGYVESAATGLWLGLFLAHKARGIEISTPPAETAVGALLTHLRRETKNFQPSNVHFGLMPELKEKIKKKERKIHYAERGRSEFAKWLNSYRFSVT